MSKSSRIVPALAVAIVALLSGCTFLHQVDVNPPVSDMPAATRAPLHAGVYYSPQFAALEVPRAVGSHIWMVPIGAASVRLFDDAFGRVFARTSRLAQLPLGGENAQGVDVVVAPALEHFDFRTGMDADSERYSVHYRTTLYSKQGVPVASWVIVGNAVNRSMGSLGGWVEDDMADAAKRLVREFDSRAAPALAAIAANSARAATLDLGAVTMTARPGTLPGLDQKAQAALRSAGILTLEISAQGAPARPLLVRRSDMRLRLGTGQVIEPLPVSLALSALEQTSQSGGGVAAIFGAPFGVLATYIEQRDKQGERDSQLRSGNRVMFEERSLGDGRVETGIVLFRLPKGTATAQGATLSAWLVDPSSAQGAQMHGAMSATQETTLKPR